MKLVIILFLLTCLAIAACTPPYHNPSHQQKSPKHPTTSASTFPQDWLGTYKGTLELFQAEKGKTMELPMTIIISETDSANHWRWYSQTWFNGKEIIKDYTLTRHDSMPPNHFIMDENNGILLDRILLDNAFYDYFEVGNLGLYGITRKVKEGIHFEIASFPLHSKRYSFYEKNETTTDTITSFKVVNTQKVLLKKVS